MIIGCIGDSLTFGFGVVESKKWINKVGSDSVKFINYGINGDTLSSMSSRCDRVLSNPMDYLFILGGINDFFMGYSSLDAYNNTLEIIRKAKIKKVIPVVGMEMYPEYSCVLEGWTSINGFKSTSLKLKEYRDLVLEYCAIENIDFIDLYLEFPQKTTKEYMKYFIDGIHPIGEGHEIMAEIINNKFNKIIKGHI